MVSKTIARCCHGTKSQYPTSFRQFRQNIKYEPMKSMMDISQLNFECNSNLVTHVWFGCQSKYNCVREPCANGRLTYKLECTSTAYTIMGNYTNS